MELVQEDAEPAWQEAEPQVDPVPSPTLHRLAISQDSHAQSHDGRANSGATAIQGENQRAVDVDPHAEAQPTTRDPINPERDELLVRRRLIHSIGTRPSLWWCSIIQGLRNIVDDVFKTLYGLARRRDEVGPSKN